MGTLFRLLTLILCVELIVGPIQPSLSLLSTKAYAESCPTGFSYDSTLNRCLTKDETTAVMNATASCGSDVECYKNNAKSAFQAEVNKGNAPKVKESNQFMSKVANVATIAVPLSIMLAGTAKSTSTCSSISYWGIVGGSAAFIIGDNLANFQHGKRLKDLKKAWGKIVNPEQANGDKDKERQISIEAQGQSFEMLAKAEDSMAKAATMKKNFYTIAAIAFTAAGVAAAYEMIAASWNPLEACVASAPDASPAASPAADSVPAGDAAPASNQKLDIPEQDNGVFKSSKSSINPIQYKDYANIEKPHFLDHKFYKLMNDSKDLASFIINRKALSEKYSSPSLDEYNKLQSSLTLSLDEEAFILFKEYSSIVMKNLSLMSSAHAQINTNAAKSYKEDEAKGIDWLSMGIGAVAGYAAGKMFGEQLQTPTARAILSGVMAGWTGIMAKHAADQAEASKKRADLLRKMKAEFVSASGAIYTCKSEDRNDPAKPNCYCYTAENARNPNRGNSKICTDLWAGINTKSTDYNSTTGTTKVCVTNQGKSDANCACKTTKTCMKLSVNGLKGLDVGSMSVLSSAFGPLNGVANGSLDAANLNDASLANLGIKAQALKNKIENSKALAGHKKNKNKRENDLIKRVNARASSVSGNPFLGNNAGMPSNAGEAARMLEKELESSQAPTSISSNDSISTPSNGAPKEGLEFGLTSDDLAAQETQIAEVMKENLEYGGNDTNSDASANIFEVLSQRYQKSGMKRLFAEPAQATSQPVPQENTAQK